MLKLTFFIIQFLLILALVALLVSNSFIISFDIRDYKYSFSSNIFFGSLLGLLFILYIIQYLYFKAKFSFHKYILVSKSKKLKKGYSFFVDAMIAIANKDNKKAISSNKKMLTYLKDDPTLSILLKAEVLKMEKKFDQLSSVYEEMIKRRNTETLGYRGLMEQNLNQQDFHHAFIYGEKLFFLNPKIEKLYDTLIYIIAKTKNWNQLLLITEKAFSHKIIERDIANENKSIAYYEIAKIKMMSDAKESMKLIHKALSLKKNFAPYIKLYLEILFSLNQVTQVKKLLKKYWSESPSPILRNVIADLLVANNLDDLELIKSVVNKNINHDDSKKLLIFFAIRLNNWELARSNIKGLLSTKPSRELCLFMADIEAGEFNDIQKSDAWKLRAKTSDLENLWICKISNQPQHEWESLSQSGYFNSLEWKQPKMLNQFIETA